MVWINLPTRTGARVTRATFFRVIRAGAPILLTCLVINLQRRALDALYFVRKSLLLSCP